MKREKPASEQIRPEPDTKLGGITYCRECRWRYTSECPVRFEDYGLDLTEDDGFCNRGTRRDQYHGEI